MGLERLNLNVARAFVGRHVADAKREEESGKPAVFCTAQTSKRPLRIFLKEIEWMDQLDHFLLA